MDQNEKNVLNQRETNDLEKNVEVNDSKNDRDNSGDVINIQESSDIAINIKEKVRCAKCGAELDEGQKFCVKCGHGVNELVDVPKGKRKKKRKVFLIIIVLLVLIVGGAFTWGMYAVGWSLDQFKVVVAEGHFQCFINHDFQDANCEHGRLCKECGYEVGEKTDHEWKEANCTTPKKCSVCNQTEGNALGHSTRLGYCSKCDKYITELSDEFYDIKVYIATAIDKMDPAQNYFSAAASSYYLRDTYLAYAKSAMQDVGLYCSKAVDACGSYSEFSKLRSYLNKAKSEFYTSSSSFRGMQQAFSNGIDYMTAALEEVNKLQK